jgi:hypothetical protein
MLLLGFLALISSVDIRYRIIPKRILFLSCSVLFLSRSLTVLGWALFLFIVYGSLYRVANGSIGYGDVRLAPLAAIVAAETSPLLVHAGAWVLAGLFLLIRRRLNSSIPFAPFFSLSLITNTHL